MPEYAAEAEQAAREWLALADDGRAEDTWSSAATLFRRAMSTEEWARALDVARMPLGAVVSRSLKEGRPATELPGAPDGQYVVFEFETSFERKRSAVETVTPMLDADGTWRVAGYFIR